ncbi:MAG: TonB-dependent receptor [Gammaproteobacteria bacterium]|nr:TonB-dependent receptor [Gammaproteobacteria bacterium]
MPAAGADDGVSLDAALQALSRAGLRLVYSSHTVPPDLRVPAPPAGLTGEALLRELLRATQLEARPLPGGGYVIVRAEAPALALTFRVVSADPEAPLPVGGAAIRVAPAAHVARTDAAGQASVTGLAPGQYLVQISAPGFQTQRINVALTPDSAGATVQVSLPPVPAPLAQITIESDLLRSDTAAGANFSRAELGSTPEVSEDAVRAAQLVPGSAVAGYGAKSHVRGSRDDENLIRFDGVELADPYHLDLLQSLVSVVDPSAVEQVTVWDGVAPIQFGNYLGAAVDIQPRHFDTTQLGVRLTSRDAALLAGGPFADDSASAFVVARTNNATSPAAWLQPENYTPHYNDLLLHASWTPAPGTQLVFGAVGLYDQRDVLSTESPTPAEQARFSGNDLYVWLRLIQQLGPAIRSETLLTTANSLDHESGTLDRPGIESGSLYREVQHEAVTVRQEFNFAPARSWSALLGAERTDARIEDALNGSASYLPPFVPFLQPATQFSEVSSVSYRAVAGSLYGSVHWQPIERITAELAARRDTRNFSAFAGDGAWSYRGDLTARLAEGTTARLGAGQNTQADLYGLLRGVGPTPQPFAPRHLRQLTADLEQILTAGWRLQLAAYLKRETTPFATFENFLSPFELMPDIEIDRQLLLTQSSRMRGAELQLNHDSERWHTTLSYARSRAEDEISGAWYPRSWDQPDALQLLTRRDAGRWQLSALLSWHSGWPYTPLLVAPSSWQNPAQVNVALGTRNGQRLESFFGTDLRAAWQRPYAGGQLRVFVELDDASNSSAACCRHLQLTTLAGGLQVLSIERTPWLTPTPWLGVEWSR